MSSASQSFTQSAPGRLRELISQCWIAPAFNPTLTGVLPPKFQEFQAIWDTGATNTVISPSVVAACGLKPIGMAEVITANEKNLAEVYMVAIGLPNRVGFPIVRVTSQNLTTTPVLIGMDIITSGDFAVTNKDGKTKFSFRFPSVAEIDFVDPIHRPASAFPVVGPNKRCPCGSGQKYRNCHGKKDA